MKRASIASMLSVSMTCAGGSSSVPTGAAPAAPAAPRVRMVGSTAPSVDPALDDRVADYLRKRRGAWHDYNVPYEDGEELEQLVLGCRCTHVLEIGTSTGHSTIWLAKAVAQTGGKVTTLEMDPGRHREAIANFETAGVAHLIDARLGDAMKILPTLNDEFDFVFSDATWSTQPEDGYTQFFRLVEPKLKIGGLFTMHNVTDGYGDDGRFFRYLDSLHRYETRILKKSSAGISVSRKMASGPI